ncbi:hypothetical protein NP233_g1339 [Leucocoprinus birnbaumii]|uniref:Nephrocystin 3-like N-terminal domain-containing protein n=1 Tax=Leucocoprinus birnbaumii TaxID=56174 RepID=A0AAD5W2S0_9AGAR|nr:hypothetical protein NP233_g1339 [Leucocoprinus birnbaumii]
MQGSHNQPPLQPPFGATGHGPMFPTVFPQPGGHTPFGFPYPGPPSASSAMMPAGPMHGYPYAAYQQSHMAPVGAFQHPNTPAGSAGPFHNASNFVMNQPQFYNMHIFENGIPVLERLYQASIHGTEIDAKARYPPPRCHPGTRVSVTKDISDWMLKPDNANRRWGLLWLFGFAGVGKTAVAQTVGEFAKEQTAILGAAFFFSRTRKQNDPSRVFISIAYQLATVNGDFRHFVNQQLIQDWSLLDKDMRTQFRKLLVEPLTSLKLQNKLEKKLLIIVDGLDECAGYEEQCEIIELISKAPADLPVIWMICSRPESHIKRKFSDADSKIDCWRKELPVDDSETRRDIETFFRSQFEEIRKKYYVDVKEDGSWPSAEIVEKIVSAASGLFVYASTAAKYIGDPTVADPDSQLKALIDFIDDSPAKSATTNPLHYLDKLYEQILSEVQPGLVDLALKILGTASQYNALSALQLANLYGVTEGKFYTALIRLHSVAIIPTADKASRESVTFFHASFFDFLKNPQRSGRFAVYPDRIHAEFAKACFNVLNQTKLRYAKNLAWPPKAGDTPAFSIAHQILAFAADNVWTACMNLEDAGDPELFDVIVKFRYPFLRFIEDKIPVPKFASFIQWLMKQIRIHGIEDIIQAVKWKDEYLEETFGSTAIDKSGNNSGNSSLSSFTLGLDKNSVTVMLSSDFIILSCED